MFFVPCVFLLLPYTILCLQGNQYLMHRYNLHEGGCEMLYGIMRYVLGVVVFAIVFLLIKKSRISKKKSAYLISLIIITILTTLLYFIPIENLFISFSSPENAFKYMNTWKIDSIVNGSETDLIIASKNKVNTYKIIPKTNNTWKISTDLETKKYIGFYNGVSISVYKYKTSNDYYIALFNTDGGRIDISDNLNSKFFSVNKINTAFSEPIYYYYTCVYNLDDTYVLNINGEEIKVRDVLIIK